MCQAGQTEAGKKVLLEALAMEPDCEYVHVNGVGVLLLAKDWPGVCRSMQFLEKNCGYEFRGNMEDEMWAEFLEAPDSKPWR